MENTNCSYLDRYFKSRKIKKIVGTDKDLLLYVIKGYKIVCFYDYKYWRTWISEIFNKYPKAMEFIEFKKPYCLHSRINDGYIRLVHDMESCKSIVDGIDFYI